MSITRTRNPVCKVSWRPAENGNSLQFLTRMSKAVDIKLSNFQSLNWGGGSKIHLYLKWNVWQIVLNGLTGHVHCVWKLLKMSHLNLVILFDCKLRVLKNRQNWSFLAFFMNLLSTQNVNVARFARIIECDFFYDFQTPCMYKTFWVNL